jgi:hypothetical protein
MTAASGGSANTSMVAGVASVQPSPERRRVSPRRGATAARPHEPEEGAMATKTVADKLLIKPGTTVWSSDASRVDLLDPLPDDVRRVDAPAEAAVAVVFADDAAALHEVLAARGQALARPSVLWIAYPKGNRADINRDTLWPILAEHGLRPVSQVSLGDVWSALRFRPLREGEAPFTGGR